MLQSILAEDKKLLCPRCGAEVKEYPPEEMKQAKFTCSKCKSLIVFVKKDDKYITWISGEF